MPRETVLVAAPRAPIFVAGLWNLRPNSRMCWSGSLQSVGTCLRAVLYLICMLLMKHGNGADIPPPAGPPLSPAQIFSPFILPTSPPLLLGGSRQVSLKKDTL